MPGASTHAAAHAGSLAATHGSSYFGADQRRDLFAFKGARMQCLSGGLLHIPPRRMASRDTSSFSQSFIPLQPPQGADQVAFARADQVTFAPADFEAHSHADGVPHGGPHPPPHHLPYLRAAPAGL